MKKQTADPTQGCAYFGHIPVPIAAEGQRPVRTRPMASRTALGLCCIIAGVLLEGLVACRCGDGKDTPVSQSPRRPSLESGPAVIGAQEQGRGEYLVTRAPGYPPAVVQAAVLQALQSFRPEIRKGAPEGYLLVYLGDDPGLDRVKAALQGRREIQAVQPNFVYHANPSGIPGGPR